VLSCRPAGCELRERRKRGKLERSIFSFELQGGGILENDDQNFGKVFKVFPPADSSDSLLKRASNIKNPPEI
jgi:hypothetical protein